jgi:hypothetical protein
MPDNEDAVIKGLAQSLGVSEADAAKMMSAGKSKLLEEYAALKATDPKIAELEQKSRAQIQRYAQHFRVSEAEAAAFVLMPGIKMQQERAARKGKPKMTEAELKQIIGTDHEIPQDVLDMLEDEKP